MNGDWEYNHKGSVAKTHITTDAFKVGQAASRVYDLMKVRNIGDNTQVLRDQVNEICRMCDQVENSITPTLKIDGRDLGVVKRQLDEFHAVLDVLEKRLNQRQRSSSGLFKVGRHPKLELEQGLLDDYNSRIHGAIVNLQFVLNLARMDSTYLGPRIVDEGLIGSLYSTQKAMASDRGSIDKALIERANSMIRLGTNCYEASIYGDPDIGTDSRKALESLQQYLAEDLESRWDLEESSSSRNGHTTGSNRSSESRNSPNRSQESLSDQLPRMTLKVAISAMIDQDWNRAVSTLSEAQRLMENTQIDDQSLSASCSKLIFYQAFCAFELLDAKTAVWWLEKALSIETDFPRKDNFRLQVFSRLISAYMRIDDTSNAIKTCKTLHKLHKEMSNVKLNIPLACLAKIYGRLSNMPQAKGYEKMLEEKLPPDLQSKCMEIARAKTEVCRPMKVAAVSDHHIVLYSPIRSDAQWKQVLVWSPSGSVLATTSGSPNHDKICMWDIAQNKDAGEFSISESRVLHEVRCAMSHSALIYTDVGAGDRGMPDARRISIRRVPNILDSNSPPKKSTSFHCEGAILQLIISPDGTTLFYHYKDRNTNKTVMILKNIAKIFTSPFPKSMTLPTELPIEKVMWSDDLLGILQPGSLLLWDRTADQAPKELKCADKIMCIASNLASTVMIMLEDGNIQRYTAEFESRDHTQLQQFSRERISALRAYPPQETKVQKGCMAYNERQTLIVMSMTVSGKLYLAAPEHDKFELIADAKIVRLGKFGLIANGRRAWYTARRDKSYATLHILDVDAYLGVERAGTPG